MQLIHEHSTDLQVGAPLRQSLAFWGKTYHASSNETAQSVTILDCKPLLHHLIDVAAVAETFLQRNPARLAREAALLDVAPEAYARLAGFMSGLHDLGKYSRSFQILVPRLWPIEALGPPPPAAPSAQHWRLTALLLRAMPTARLWKLLFPELDIDGLNPIIAAIAGHHGQPPSYNEVGARPTDAARSSDIIGGPCVAASATAVDGLFMLFKPEPVTEIGRDDVLRWSWGLSGLITLADWVASDATHFGPTDQQRGRSLNEYLADARIAAHHALNAKGLTPPTPRCGFKFTDLAPAHAVGLRPMQAASADVALAAGPQLFIIEDATGSGKTEAAMLLAARLMAARRGEGVFWALPTMATANAMHDRLKDLPERLFEATDGLPPSLTLVHGKANVAQRFAELLNPISKNSDDPDDVGAFCNAWIADDRRRALFADVGAGTIDQTFLSVLPKRHLTLRQYALAGRILIVDEAHCFDLYMRQELARLLELHAMNGGSAIVLSATLARGLRSELCLAFAQGLGQLEPAKLASALSSDAYPLLTQVAAQGTKEMSVCSDDALRRRIRVRRLIDRKASVAAALAAATQGAAVLIICNAVDEVIEVHSNLIEAGAPPLQTHMFHARFAQGDRQKIEDAMLARFGRTSAHTERRGNILVASQVVEQSLDLDFDLIITDLAPVDLLIQRAGRLWRHMDSRPAVDRPIDGPELLVVSPDPEDVQSPDWLEPVLGRAAPVYGRAKTMWPSAVALFNAGEIASPEGLRPLVEAVYDPYLAPTLPDALTRAELSEAGEEQAARALGLRAVVNLGDGYNALDSNLSRDEDIGTRLSEPTITLRLARRVGGILEPWMAPSGADWALAWALSELRLRAAFWGSGTPPAEDLELHKDARRDWPDWEEPVKLVEVAANGDLCICGARFEYSTRTGLRRKAED